LSKEQPLLLDPLSLSDVNLIYISVDGRAEPLVADASDLRNRRAKQSIALYHLNEDDVVKLRAVVQKTVLDLIRLGDGIAVDASAAGIANLSVVKKTLEDHLASNAIYVTMTRQVFRSVKGRGSSWLDEVREIEMPLEFPT
jgi:hypothetical protein